MGAEKKNVRVHQGNRKGTSSSVYLSPGDEEMVRSIMKELGVGQSEAIRTAIRVYAILLKR